MTSVLDPLIVGGVTLRNRTAMSATVNNLGRNDDITDRLVAFYRERALGGIGAIVTEGLSVHPTSIPNPTVPLAFDQELIPGFRKLSEAVHEAGAVVFGQLWHVGRQALWNPSLVPWGVSGMRDPYSGSTPHVMTDTEIVDVVDGFVSSAVNLQRAGFDGVELHGAHGYLITQFLSPFSNQRTDRWGGTIENRSRFVLEIIAGIRKAAGDEFVIGLKLPAHEYVTGGLDLEGTQELVAHIVGQDRPDYLATGQGNFSPSLEKHVPDLHFPDVPFAHLPRGVRAVSDGVPVMAITKVPDQAAAQLLIDEGSADLVGMSRPLIADPHLVRKWSEGVPQRPCIFCNVCWDYIHTGRAVSCVYAPDSYLDGPRSSDAPRLGPGLTIHVIGGGPAGLEFARVALEEGNGVVLHEASNAVGGRMSREAEVEGREVYGHAVSWLEGEVLRLGGEIVVNDPVPLQESRSLDGDLTVVATGAVPVVDPLAGLDRVVSLEDVIAGRAEIVDPVVIVDEVEAEPVYGVAEQLVRAGHQVALVTRRAAIGRRVPYINIIGVHRRLDELGIAVHALTVPKRVIEGVLTVAHAFSGREYPLGPVGTVVRAGPYRTTVDDQSAFEVVVGDASAPRDLLAAVRDASDHATALFAPPRQRR